MNRNTKITLFAVIGLLILGMAFFPKIRSIFSTEKPQTENRGRSPRGGSGAGREQLSVTAMIIQPQVLRSDLYCPGRIVAGRGG
ncbi:hypothetical protein ING2E5A_2202 [Petrimonas mucosa]|uniref:Uncharacterized protein n=1 Tax=Petrimonas mucosa TaxID=1642646 RepID=A0A1G4G931_9BACT|nr:hypothetical protein [Petrimonas mucosa]SCM59015.1 hypothetical protein ING2E5A_2202 [Petrimonas mucosa]